MPSSIFYERGLLVFDLKFPFLFQIFSIDISKYKTILNFASQKIVKYFPPSLFPVPLPVNQKCPFSNLPLVYIPPPPITHDLSNLNFNILTLWKILINVVIGEKYIFLPTLKYETLNSL